ncbi:MAG TPA: class I SAM-dependent methyltransferase [Usitatibacter sp.]|nr:class I SAM-dependent methyltransferase [Usitatibacter sp.]
MGACRFCNKELTTSFADLGMSPVSNAFIREDKRNAMERFYPLHAYVCDGCHLVQLEQFESPEQIFNEEYAYFSSYSDSWLAHAKAYCDQMEKLLGLGPKSQVIEIASNDGYLLQYFVQKGIPVLGVEPAANVARAAEQKGVPSLVKFFGVQTARELAVSGMKADLLLGNNVLAHVPNINDFVGGMKVALAPHGVITMEFPHLLELMRHNQFDTIYHEHFSYLSLHTTRQIFAAHGLRLFDVEQLTTHGGSLRIYACHEDDAARPVTQRLEKLAAEEGAAGLESSQTYGRFAEQVRETKRKLLAFLIQAKRDGRTIVGYGAPAKGNTLLNYCGVRTDFIDYTVDRSPAKQGTYLPGVHIPVYAPDKIFETKPDYVLILPWNLREEVMSQMAGISAWGGKFVVPIPEARVYG